MFGKRDYSKISFHGVGLALIIFGAIIFAISGATWVVNLWGVKVSAAFPFFKMMAAAMIISMGYIILEIELLRKK